MPALLLSLSLVYNTYSSLVMVFGNAGQRSSRVEHAFDFVSADTYLSRLRAVQRPYNSLLFHHLDDTRRTRVADPESTLQHRSGCLPVINH